MMPSLRLIVPHLSRTPVSCGDMYVIPVPEDVWSLDSARALIPAKCQRCGGMLDRTQTSRALSYGINWFAVEEQRRAPSLQTAAAELREALDVVTMIEIERDRLEEQRSRVHDLLGEALSVAKWRREILLKAAVRP